jgi:hypothetical protein
MRNLIVNIFVSIFISFRPCKSMQNIQIMKYYICDNEAFGKKC